MILGLYYWGYNIGILEKKMETTIVYWGYIRVIVSRANQHFTCTKRMVARAL